MQRAQLKKIFVPLIILATLIGMLLLLATITNPYGTPTVIEKPFHASVDKTGAITLQQQYPVHFTQNLFAQKFAELNKGTRLVLFALFPERPFNGTEDEIITSIHKKGFNPQRPYIISGAQFADIYVRNLGIFYNAVMDNRLRTSEEDWLNRQKIYLQGLALNLELLKQTEKEYTTFIPIIHTTYSAANVFTDPSDSLFGVLYALSALKDDSFIHTLFPAKTPQKYPLKTQKAADELLKEHTSSLQKAINDYHQAAIDQKTGFIKKDITLSSARDGIKRESSFYDNVILWSTIKFARDLDIAVTCPSLYTLDDTCDFVAWKNNITKTFWDEKSGIFLDDLSTESRDSKIFSGDSFIVLGSGFFTVSNDEDKRKLQKMITYVEANGLSEPFPLFYAKTDHVDKLYTPVKTFATSYTGETIWSHWGIEYIKALILLSVDQPQYKKLASTHLSAYRTNIEKNGGYPELYDKQGNLYQTLFYRSILHTSWVINYEQAKMLLENSQ